MLSKLKERTTTWNLKHGFYGTRFYRIWQSMKTRCENPNHEAFHRYGGRGIRFDPKWKSFDSFKEDMYETYLAHVKEFGEKDTSINRTDNNKNYSKENCEWATKKEQSLNTKTSRYISFNGETLNITLWAKRIGMNKQTLCERFKKGWSVEKALTTPLAGT